jgi:hypothetical protein
VAFNKVFSLQKVVNLIRLKTVAIDEQREIAFGQFTFGDRREGTGVPSFID